MAAKAISVSTTRRTRPRWVRWTKRIFAFLFLCFLIGATVFGVVFVKEMRHASELMTTFPQKIVEISTKPTVILSSDNKELSSMQAEFREPVKYDEIPVYVRNAMMAAEDKRFMEHQGVDYIAMGRILMVGAKEGRLSQGGSTLTMQLAKKFYSEGERTFNRKLQDVALAITMEREMTKEQILTLYLNTMYFGEKAYGIQAAADVYFGKPLDKLTISEAAMLARCVRRPSDQNPVKNYKVAVQNRNVVLGIMRDQNMINESQYEKAIEEKIKIKPPKERVTSHLRRAPYFVDQVMRQLEHDMPDIDFKAGGYTIRTTLNAGMQDYAEAKVAEAIREGRGRKINSACFVMIDKDGKILAEVGGQDYGKSQFNIVTQGLLQPGSSFKPILYSAALSTGAISPDERIPNMPFEYDMGPYAKPWTPRNASSRENSGPVSIERAIALSLNIAAAHVMEKVTPPVVAGIARDAFGFTTPLDAVPAMALGAVEVRPIDMAQAYSVFMLHGNRATPYAITQVIGPDGTIIREYSPNIKQGVFDPRVTSLMDGYMRAVVEYGTGTYASNVENSRGKTGTTTDQKDGWFCGYSDGLVAIAWVGNLQIKNGKQYKLPMSSGVYGGNSACHFWTKIMERAHDKFAVKIPEYKEPEQTAPPIDERGQDEDVAPGDRVKVIPPPDDSGTTGGDGAPTSPNGGDTVPPTDGDKPVTSPPVETEPPPADPPRTNPRSRSRDDGDSNEMVTVDICAESGQRATIYCPETISRQFRKGREPKGRCKIHGG